MGEQERQTRQDRAGSSAHPGCPEGARRRCPGTAQAVPGDRAGIFRRPAAELHPRLTESPIHRPGTNVVLRSYRQCASTSVLAHWSTVQPAYRVTLDDAAEPIASGDTRFLS